MRFTFWSVGAPLLVAFVSFVFTQCRDTASLAALLGFVWFPWLLVGAPATTIYWFVRLVRHAWRDEPRREEPDSGSGRIFGRL